MKAIIGLGNPGEKYRHSRHNAGFDVMDILSQKLDTPIKKPKFQAVYGETLLNGEKTLLVKPQTFMNLSGFTVSDVMAFYKLQPKDVLLIVPNVRNQPAHLEVNIPQHVFDTFSLKPVASAQATELLSGEAVQTSFTPERPSPVEVPALSGVILKIRTR